MEHKEGAQEGEAEGKAKAQGKKRKEREAQKGRCRLLATATGCNKGDACKYDHPTELRCPQCKSFKTIKEFSRAQLLKWKAKPVCKECLQETEDALLQQQQSAEEPSRENKKRTQRKKKRKAEEEGPVTEKGATEGGGDNGEDEKDEGKQTSALLGRCKFLGSPQGCPNPKVPLLELFLDIVSCMNCFFFRNVSTGTPLVNHVAGVESVNR